MEWSCPSKPETTTSDCTLLDCNHPNQTLAAAVKPEGRVKLGSLLADIGRKARLTGEEFAIFDEVRDKTPARPVRFE